MSRSRTAWRAARPYVAVLALSTLVVSRWFRTGTFIAAGDMGPFIRRGWADEANWAWNHQTTGAGSAGYTMARGFEFVLIWLCKSVGLTEYSAQWLFYVCIYGLVGFGCAYLAGAFVRSQPAIVAAGAFGLLNGFFLTRLPNPLNIISVGSIALITGIAVRVAQGRRVPAPIAGFALMPTSFLSFNPPMLVVAYAWAVGGTPLLALLVLGRRPAVRLLKWFVAATPWALCLNAFWLIPLTQSFTGGGGATANATFTDPTNWSWSQVNNIPPNILTMVANWAWYRPQYLPFAEALDSPGWIWLRYLLPALVFLAPVLATRRLRRAALMLVGLTLVVVFLAKGLRPPFNKINMFLYLHAPGFWLFREPMSKLGQLLVPFFGMLLAIGLEGTLLRLRTVPRLRLPGWPRRSAYAASAVPLLLVLAYPYPLYTGGVMPDERPTQPSTHVRVAPEWWDLAAHLDADRRSGKVLVLPLDDYYQMPTTWGFFGVDSIANLLVRHPVVQPKPDGYFGDVAGFSADVKAIEAALLAGDLTPVPRLLDAIGASRVIVRHDLVRGLPNRYFADDRRLAAAMDRVPGGRLEVDGLLQLWTFGDGSSPLLRTYDRVLDAPMRADAGAAVLGTVDTHTAVAARPSTAAPPLSPQVDDTAAVTPDVVHWPVPAVDSGAPETTVETPAGRWTLAQRARAAAVLYPGLDRDGRRLRLTDPTVVTVDGRAVSRRPSLSVPVPAGRRIVALQSGNRTVSLDVPGRAAGVPVGAATELTLLAAARTPAAVSDYAAVSDCNDYEPRPWADLGLSRRVTGAGADRTVRLTAADHAACTTVRVSDVKAGQLYRVRLQYRHRSGSRPQICLLQSGSSGCELAARPKLADGWNTWERTVTVDTDGDLDIVLHADAGRRFGTSTVNEYRGLRVDAMEAVATRTVWPPAVPEVTVDLTAGKHRLAVEGGAAGSVLAPFEPLEDCFRYDDQNAEQAGLAAETQVGENGETTYTLKAIRHLACIGSSASDVGAASLYELSMQARSVAVRNPKFCLFLRGPDLCRTLPAVALYQGWTRYETLIPPDENAVETRLYLYGLRDLKEQQQSQVEYRGVRLRPVASPSSIVLVRQVPATGKAAVDWEKSNPTKFTGTVVSTGPTAVALTESATPGWVLTGVDGARKVTLQGWMSGWLLPAGGEITIRYAPARIARAAYYLLPVTVLAALVFMGLTRMPPGRPGAWVPRHRPPRRRRWRLRWHR